MRDTTKENLPQPFQLTKLRLLHSLNYGVPTAPRKTKDRNSDSSSTESMTENLLNLYNLLPQDFVQKYSGLASQN